MENLLIPITAILMPLALVPTIISMKNRHRRREWEHLERMKSLESHWPMQPAAHPGLTKSITAIGAGVPTISVLGAILTTLLCEPPVDSDPAIVPGIVWGCASMISLGALATSLILAFMHSRSVRQAASSAAMYNSKPQFDPDAFDVVSARG